MKHFISAAITAITLALPIAASAQDVPTYAQPAAVSQDENIHGRVTAFDGAYALTVRDDRGFIDNVQLHQGTIINPTGLTLQPGMVVSILGYNGGNYFAANEIDTPYQFVGDIPYYAGHPYYYYGPSISLGFFFGSPGWWHGYAFSGGYRYVGGARVYAHVNTARIYHGGTYSGRAYVAGRAYGGYAPHGNTPYHGGERFAQAFRGGGEHGGGEHGGGEHGGGQHGGGDHH